MSIICFAMIALIFFVSCKTSKSIRVNQSIALSFPCDTNFKITKSKSGDKVKDWICDSLANINYSKIDMEIHIWASSIGMIGNLENVFVIKHFRRQNKWKAYCYNGYKYHSYERKSFADFFVSTIPDMDTSLVFFIDELLKSNILTIQIPTIHQIEEVYNKSHPQSSNNDVNEGLPSMLISDGDGSWDFQIFTKNCKRRYSTSDSYRLGYRAYSSDLRDINHIIDVLSKQAHHTFYY